MHEGHKQHMRYEQGSHISKFSVFLKNKDVTFVRKYITTGKKARSQKVGYRLNTASHAFNRLYQSQYNVGSIIIGLTKLLVIKTTGQIAQINLVICKNFELMAGSQYP